MNWSALLRKINKSPHRIMVKQQVETVPISSAHVQTNARLVTSGSLYQGWGNIEYSSKGNRQERSELHSINGAINEAEGIATQNQSSKDIICYIDGSKLDDCRVFLIRNCLSTHLQRRKSQTLRNKQ